MSEPLINIENIHVNILQQTQMYLNDKSETLTNYQ